MVVRGVTFDKQLNKSEDDAHRMHYFYQGEMGVTKGCNISENANGDLVISDGYFDIYGRLVANVGDTIVDVPSVQSGTLFSILVFEIDLSKENTVEEFNQGDFKIVSDVQDYPELIQEDLDDGGEVYQMEFCRFENTVAGIQSLEDNRPILDMGAYATKQELDAHKAETSKKHITESGENSNGRYIQFDDGTMICTRTVKPDWTNTTERQDFAFAKGFITTPNCSYSIGSSGNAGDFWKACTGVVLMQNSSLWRIITTINYLGESGDVYLTAIGRWK